MGPGRRSSDDQKPEVGRRGNKSLTNSDIDSPPQRDTNSPDKEQAANVSLPPERPPPTSAAG